MNDQLPAHMRGSKPRGEGDAAAMRITPGDERRLPLGRALARDEQPRRRANACTHGNVGPIMLLAFHPRDANETGDDKGRDANSQPLPVGKRGSSGKGI